MEIADSIRDIAKEHILPASPLGMALERIADGLDEVEARVVALELLSGRKISDLNDFERQRLEEAKHVVDPPSPGLFDSTEAPE